MHASVGQALSAATYRRRLVEATQALLASAAVKILLLLT